MKTTNELLELISTLTEQEKKYIIKKLKTHKENSKMLKIFKEYDTILKKSYNSRESIQLNENHAESTHVMLRKKLFENILTYLGDYYDETIIEYKILKEFKKIFILFNKGFFTKCLKRLKNIENVINSWGKYEYNSLIYYFYFLLQNKNADILNLNKIHEIYKNLNKNLQLQEEINKMYYYIFEINHIRHEWGLNHIKFKEFMNEIFDSYNIQLVNQESIRFIYFDGLIKALNSVYIHKNYDEGIQIFHHILNCFTKFYTHQDNKEIYSFELNRYFLSCLYNYFTLLVHVGKKEEFIEQFEYFENFLVKNLYDDYSILLIYMLKFDFLIQNFISYKIKMEIFIPEFEKIFHNFIEKKLIKEEETLTYKRKLAWSFFLLKKYKSTYHYLNELLVIVPKEKDELEISIKTLEILYNFETNLSNFPYISYKLKGFLQQFFTNPIPLKNALLLLNSVQNKLRSLKSENDIEDYINRLEKILQIRYGFKTKFFDKQFLIHWVLSRKS